MVELLLDLVCFSLNCFSLILIDYTLSRHIQTLTFGEP